MKSDTHLLNKMFRGILITNAISIVADIACVMIDCIVTGQFLGADAVAASGLLQPVVMLINLFGGVLGGVGVMYVLPGSFLVALQTRKRFDILEHPIDGYGSNQVDYKIIRFTQQTHMQTRKKRIWHLSEGREQISCNYIKI